MHGRDYKLTIRGSWRTAAKTGTKKQTRIIFVAIA